MQWSLVPLIIAGVISGPVDEHVKTIPVDEAMEERDGKLFSVFQIVKFNNEECTGSSGDKGICFTAAECSAQSGGTADGTCASGFGVCCVTKLDPCRGTTNSPNVILEHDVQNPGDCESDDTDSAVQGQGNRRSFGRQSNGKQYDYRINRWTSAIVQMRLDFELFEIMPPSNGECTNDTLLIEEQDAHSKLKVPTNLCGTLTGSHMYFDFTENAGIDIIINVAQDVAQRWRIRVRQLEATDDLFAPRGCLQWFRTNTVETGSFMTFNHQGGNGELLNNHRYTVCIEQKTGFCDVALTSSEFDLKGSSGSCSDAVAFGTMCLCGSTFANSGSLTWNYTGPYFVPVTTAGDNSAMVAGFEISYMLLGCPN